MYLFENLNPESLWKFFNEITMIPRPSKNEEKILRYLVEFADSHNLEYKTDKAGNIVILKPPTEGREKAKPIILQSHVDMVCEKNSDTPFDFLNDSIIPYITEDNWVKARGTTLGADNGIGVAAMLAVLESKDLVHGPIEALFTVDEETGLSGAFGLESHMLTARTLVNLDSEDWGEVFVGCAGGKDTVATYIPDFIETPNGMYSAKINISGLKGGHSGDDINKQLGNAIKILNRFLYEIASETELHIVEFTGGNLRNAIPREASAILIIPSTFKEKLRVKLNIFIADIEERYAKNEPSVKMTLNSIEVPVKAWSKAFTLEFLRTIYALPNGVISMSRDIQGLVETSTNLASIKFNGEKIDVATSQRSSSEFAKNGVAQMVKSVFELSCATVTQSNGYPGWKPNLNSEILEITKKVHFTVVGTEPKVKAIHAGLECGLFLEKFRNLDMISIGPTITGAHSPDEGLKIDTVEPFWKLLLGILKMLSE